ncbi:MAG: 16S rRNA (uracil(1498)-N(3))-methyltransferase [Eubacterium sp.]|nr:16S rRNA (uracil(1498)-N(3))-methyltransferase [Eubacterium sp.]
MKKSDLINGNSQKKSWSCEKAFDKWRYPRFFAEDINEDIAVVSGDDARHIRDVLRMKKGEIVILADAEGYDCLSEIESFVGKESVNLKVLDRRKNEAEPNVKIRLYQCLPKFDKLDFIVQKATELGVFEIVPVISERCVSRPDSDRRISRMQKIACEATKQCGGVRVPMIFPFMNYKNIFKEIKQDFLGIIFYENGGEKLDNIIGFPREHINIIIGSEGGFSENEVLLAKENGYIPATLGKRILRCETAPITAISILLNLTGNI